MATPIDPSNVADFDQPLNTEVVAEFRTIS